MLSFFQPHRQSPPVYSRKQNNSHTSVSLLANSGLVPTPSSDAKVLPSVNQNAPENHYPTASTRAGPCPPSVSQASTSWLSPVRASLTAQGITEELLDVIVASWRDGTCKQYRTYITGWLKFCTDYAFNLVNPTLQHILNFLTLQSQSVGYSAVATARSALSTITKVDGVRVGEHPLVPRFMTGLFNQKPALPRYTDTNVTPEWYSPTSKRCQPLIICH